MVSTITQTASSRLELSLPSLEGEYYLFSLLGSILYRNPEKEFFASLANNRIFDDMPFGFENPALRDCFTRLKQWNDSCDTPFSDKDFEAILLDYTQLFVGLNKVPAPLWESVYFNRERMVFQEQTMDVRQWYHRYSLQVEGFQHEPDDHLGSELLFIGHLARLAKESIEKGMLEEGIATIENQTAFIRTHPERWCARWKDMVVSSAQGSFYPACAQLAGTAIQEVLRFNASLSGALSPTS